MRSLHLCYIPLLHVSTALSLQNAHCVEHCASVKVKRRGSDEKFIAHVVSMGAECDIGMCLDRKISVVEKEGSLAHGHDHRRSQAPSAV